MINDLGGYGFAITSAASNIIDGDNPPYTVENFLDFYPQFKLVPQMFLSMYLKLAHATVKKDRWNDAWEMGMGLFLAHFCTLYLQSMAAANSPAALVIARGQAQGLTTSKSVEGVSKSIDYNGVSKGLEGWATWNLTLFGQQFATFGKFLGKGGMYVG